MEQSGLHTTYGLSSVCVCVSVCLCACVCASLVWDVASYGSPHSDQNWSIWGYRDTPNVLQKNAEWINMTKHGCHLFHVFDASFQGPGHCQQIMISAKLTQGASDFGQYLVTDAGRLLNSKPWNCVATLGICLTATDSMIGKFKLWFIMLPGWTVKHLAQTTRLQMAAVWCRIMSKMWNAHLR